MCVLWCNLSILFSICTIAGSLRDGTARFRQRMGFKTCSSTGLLLFCLVCLLCWFALFLPFMLVCIFIFPILHFLPFFYFCFILVFVAYFAFLNRCFLLSPKHIIINICVLYIFPTERLQQQVVGRRLFQVWLKWTRREGCSRTKKIIFWKYHLFNQKVIMADQLAGYWYRKIARKRGLIEKDKVYFS